MNFISIQATYSQSHVALFNGSSCLEIVSYLDARSSSHLVPSIQNLLQKHGVNIHELSFFALDRGPGAFTSLRVTIATFNGVAFSHKIPLVGVDGLDALLYDIRVYSGYHIALLNAYNNDVYYAVSDKNNILIQKGCKNIDLLLQELPILCSCKNMYFVGNGTLLFRDSIKNIFADNAIFVEPIQETPLVQTIGLLAYEQFKNQQALNYSIDPLYLKTQLFAVRPGVTR